MRSPPRVPYGTVLARNLRAARAAANLSQSDVGERMQSLGFRAWLRSTVSLAEQGKRRLAAEEVYALAHVLDTSLMRLISPTEDDKRVAFPNGETIEAASARALVFPGVNDGAVSWDGNTPVFRRDSRAHVVGSWWGDEQNMPDEVKAAIRAQQDDRDKS